MKKKINSEIFSAVLYIVIGILLAVFPGEMLNIAMTVAGIFFIVSGILELVKQNWAGGAVSLVIGIAILVLGWAITWIVLIVLGVLIAIKGIIALFDAIKRKEKNVLEILFPILTIVIGILLAFGNIAGIITIVAGILLALDGVVGLIGALKN